MATITPTVVKTGLDPARKTYIVTWALGNADTGVAVNLVSAPDRSVQIAGTLGSATIVLEGSNDGTNWVTLTDPQGNPISKTVAAIEQIEELTLYIRASSSGGSGTAVTVTLLLRGMSE